MHGLQMHLMFYLQYIVDLYLHMCSPFKAFCYLEAIKSCSLPFPSSLHCTSVKRPTSTKQPLFKDPAEGGCLIEVGLYTDLHGQGGLYAQTL